MAKKNVEQEPAESVLVKAAKKIGEAAGSVAAAVGVTPAKPKVPKLVKKNKSKLPRRQKKAAAKKASAAAAKKASAAAAKKSSRKS